MPANFLSVLLITTSINRIRSGLEKKTRWYEQIGFLRRCQKEGLVPKELRVKLPSSVLKSEYGERLKLRS